MFSKVRVLRGWIIRSALRQVTAFEQILPPLLDEWHAYALTWSIEEARFEVDGEIVLRAPVVPQGPLGFVAWIDNQYAVATPEQGFSFGTLPLKEAQWLEIRDLQIDARAGVA
jgi:hypothetical protein